MRTRWVAVAHEAYHEIGKLSLKRSTHPKVVDAEAPLRLICPRTLANVLAAKGLALNLNSLCGIEVHP